MSPYSVKPILAGRHMEVFRDGKPVGNLLAPMPEVVSDQWSLAILDPTLRIRLFGSREDALRFLGIAERVPEAA